MKRSIFYSFGILLLALAAGCSNSNQPTTYPQVNYTSGQSYIYYAQVLDKNTGDTVAGSGDTITSTVLTTNASYQGMSGVTEIQNTHTHPASGATMDTTYIAQSNGNYYHYNYGIEILNGNQSVLNAVNKGKQIDVGWVLQAKLSANSGDKWGALDTNLTLYYGGTPIDAGFADTATETSDTTITIGASQVVAKHSIHSIVLNAAGAVKDTLIVDTYVSATDGPVLDKFHPTSLAGTPTPGRITIFLGKK